MNHLFRNFGALGELLKEPKNEMKELVANLSLIRDDRDLYFVRTQAGGNLHSLSLSLAL